MKGKAIITRRRIGKVLRYLAAVVTTAIGFYVLFSPFSPRRKRSGCNRRMIYMQLTIRSLERRSAW